MLTAAEAAQYWMSENTSKVPNVVGEGKNVSVCYWMIMLSLSFQFLYKLLKNIFGYFTSFMEERSHGHEINLL